MKLKRRARLGLTVAVLGLGYVGFPLAELLVKSKKYRVIGLDISEKKVAEAKAKLGSAAKGNFIATGDFAKLSEADVAVVCVPTPVYRNFLPDYGPVKNACLSIVKNLRAQTHAGAKRPLVIIESTVNPGTCEEVVLPIMERFGAISGRDFLLAHCPERIDPGNTKWTLENIPRNVGGLDEESAARAAEFYRSFLKGEVKVLNSLKAAEATKIVENTFRDINIAYVNELAMSFDKMGIDIVEVIEGAKTKPFAFMPHYPGVGVGGHCFEKNQILFLKTVRGIETVTFEELYERIQNVSTGNQEKIEVLSFDLQKQKPCFKRILLVTKRPNKTVLRLRTKYGYELKVTDRHPVVVYKGGKMTTLFAEDIKLGDNLVINRSIPSFSGGYTIDAIDAVKTFFAEKDYSKIRVGLKNAEWKTWQNELKPILQGNRRASDNYFRYNFLPLKEYASAEQKNLIPSMKNNLVLRTGRGPSTHTMPAALTIDKDLCRLVGYYVSEGCLTKDESTRVRFCFHSKEYEYLSDVKNILRKHEIPYSEFHSKRWRSSYIKISSEIFGVIIEQLLNCGTNCYNMSVPSELLALPKEWRQEMVKGMLRGDGGVDVKEGKRLYIKNNKLQFHENNSVSVNYFSSSKKLFQQMIVMLLDQNMFPKIQKRDGLLRVSGMEDIRQLRDYFEGEKSILLRRGMRNNKKILRRDEQFRHDTFLTAPVTSIETIPSDIVYSIEVEDTHTVVTSYGIVVHNCIPVDPYYLIERALHSGFEHKFLEMARKVNNGMPAYTVSLLEDELKKAGIPLRKAKIGLLGLAYKKDVGDVRESPALKVLRILKSKRLKIGTFDPYIPHLSTVKSIGELLRSCDAIIVATAHGAFHKITPQLLKKSGVKIVIDGRNFLPKEKIIGAGIVYKGIGH